MIAEDGTYLSEDFAFCKRWTDMGGEIWADLKSTLSHVGPMTFRGDLRRNSPARRPPAPLRRAQSRQRRYRTSETEQLQLDVRKTLWEPDLASGDAAEIRPAD